MRSMNRSYGVEMSRCQFLPVQAVIAIVLHAGVSGLANERVRFACVFFVDYSLAVLVM